jgi:hypothetical protein
MNAIEEEADRFMRTFLNAFMRVHGRDPASFEELTSWFMTDSGKAEVQQEFTLGSSGSH